MLPLGFRFDVDAVIVGSTAHRESCPRMAPAASLVRVFAGEIYRSDCCPRECPRCRPPFETLLTYQLEPLEHV
jgi:hypothetical protein